jgi:hypothetical protein
MLLELVILTCDPSIHFYLNTPAFGWDMYSVQVLFSRGLQFAQVKRALMMILILLLYLLILWASFPLSVFLFALVIVLPLALLLLSISFSQVL